MYDIDIIIEQYVSIEQVVRGVMEQQCINFCTCCPDACCRLDYCIESVESPFLRMVIDRYPPRCRFNQQHGWLTTDGCCLAAGRPPVCYQFLCDRQLASQPNEMHRYILRVLSSLISHLGQDALGGRHLVEIATVDELNKIRADRFDRRRLETGAALLAITTFFKTHYLHPGERQILSQILPLPESIAEMEKQ